MSITLRHAKETDLDQCATLFAHYYKKDETVRYFLEAEEETLESFIRSFALLKGKEYLKRKEIVLVALNNDEICGFLVLKQGFKATLLDKIKIYTPTIFKTLFHTANIVKRKNYRALTRLSQPKAVELPVLTLEVFAVSLGTKDAVLKTLIEEAMSYVNESKYFTALFSVTADMNKKALLEKMGFKMKDIRQNNDLRLFHMVKPRTK